MMPKILLVDDEPSVLAGYERTLRRDFEVDTAVGGELGLESLMARGPYAVVVSDMRMPNINGAQFLAMARKKAPDTVRMLLTGYSDVDAAMQAVNEGNIFRFLSKPCPREILVAAIHAGVQQNQLIRSERDLLEKTLVGSIGVLSDCLSASSPEASNRSIRISRIVRHIADKFTFGARWRLDAAATLSQLGCITLDPDLVRDALTGMKLSPEDQVRFNAHPQAAMRLLNGIPRLEATSWIIGQQFNRNIPAEVPVVPEKQVAETILDAKILKLAVAFDDLRSRSITVDDALTHLRGRSREFEWELLDALIGMRFEGRKLVARKLLASRVTTGMILNQEIRSRQGMLLIANGQEITCTLLMKIENYLEAGITNRDIDVLVPE